MSTALAHDRWTEGRRVLRRLREHVAAMVVWEVLPPSFPLPSAKPILAAMCSREHTADEPSPRMGTLRRHPPAQQSKRLSTFSYEATK